MDTFIWLFQVLAVLSFSLLAFVVCTGYSRVSEKRWNQARFNEWQRQLTLEAKRRERESEYMNHT